jgi:N-acetylglutamate synthase and related acetyltransferases
MEVNRDGFTISTEKPRLQTAVIYRFLSEDSYWAKTRTPDQMNRAIENSLCFGVYQGDEQVGFARVVSDFATFAYFGDVFILEGHRGHGLGKWLMETVVAHPDLQGLRRWLLATKDAHGLYSQFGFDTLRFPERWMEYTSPDAY